MKRERKRERERGRRRRRMVMVGKRWDARLRQNNVKIS